jgi:hypothetical protein
MSAPVSTLKVSPRQTTFDVPDTVVLGRKHDLKGNGLNHTLSPSGADLSVCITRIPSSAGEPDYTYSCKTFHKVKLGVENGVLTSFSLRGGILEDIDNPENEFYCNYRVDVLDGDIVVASGVFPTGPLGDLYTIEPYEEDRALDDFEEDTLKEE